MPLVRHGFSTARFGGLGATTPTNVDLSGSGGTFDSNNINNDINVGRQIINAVQAGDIRDQVRQNRVNVISSLAMAGSVLAAQICLAGPSNVASNEQPYWSAAIQAIQQRRPDVYAAAQHAGPYWPVGQPFNMLAIRQEICASLAQNGITVNSQACNAAFGLQCTDEGGSCAQNNPINVTVTGVTTQVVQDTPPGQQPPTNQPITNPLNIAGTNSPILLLAIAGAAVYFVMQQRKRAG